MCFNLHSDPDPSYGLRPYVDFLELQQLIESIDTTTNVQWNQIIKLTFEQIKYLRDENDKLKLLLSDIRDCHGK
jgi:hypothetical protein